MGKWSEISVQRINPAVIDLMEMLSDHGCHVAGGYARWACSPRNDSPLPSDIDVICPSKEAFEGAKADAIIAGAVARKDTDFSFTFRGYHCPLKIQLLKTYLGRDLREAMSSIDFTVCRVALLNQHAALADRDFLSDERNSCLQVVAIEEQSVVNTFCRMLRYARKGYDISQADIIRVLEVIKGADIEASPALAPECASYRDVGS